MGARGPSSTIDRRRIFYLDLVRQMNHDPLMKTNRDARRTRTAVRMLETALALVTEGLRGATGSELDRLTGEETGIRDALRDLGA